MAARHSLAGLDQMSQARRSSHDLRSHYLASHTFDLLPPFPTPLTTHTYTAPHRPGAFVGITWTFIVPRSAAEAGTHHRYAKRGQ